jgi:hypothetical protein
MGYTPFTVGPYGSEHSNYVSSGLAYLLVVGESMIYLSEGIYICLIGSTRESNSGSIGRLIAPLSWEYYKPGLGFGLKLLIISERLKRMGKQPIGSTCKEPPERWCNNNLKCRTSVLSDQPAVRTFAWAGLDYGKCARASTFIHSFISSPSLTLRRPPVVEPSNSKFSPFGQSIQCDQIQSTYHQRRDLGHTHSNRVA